MGTRCRVQPLSEESSMFRTNRRDRWHVRVLASVSQRRSRRSMRPKLEILDDRTLLSGFYVAVNGSPSGDGSMSYPWNLQTALSQPSTVHAGDTIQVLQGRYVGNFTSNLSGVTVRGVRDPSNPAKLPV